MPVSISGTNGVTFPDSSLQAAAASPYVLKNRIINGDMRIDQRNAGASVTAAVGYTYSVDRFAGYAAAASKFTMQQSTTAPTGFVNSALMTSSAATTPAASDAYGFLQRIEGYNISDLGWGTANAKTITISFWVRSSITGTYAVTITNSYARCYPAEYTISVANTWEQKSVTIAGDTSGTWLTTNGIGAELWFDLGSGSTFYGTANSWNGSLKVRTSSSSNWIGTNGATFYITGVQLEQNTSATPFERRLYGQELANCQRYYEQTVIGNMQIPNGSGSAMINPISFHVQKRASPTMATITAATTNGAATVQLNGVSVNNFGLQFINSSTTNNFFTNSPVYSASAEL